MTFIFLFEHFQSQKPKKGILLKNADLSLYKKSQSQVTGRVLRGIFQGVCYYANLCRIT